MAEDKECDRAGGNRDEIGVDTACSVLFSGDQTVEVRAVGKFGIASGYFNNYEKLSRAVRSLDAGGECAGIYVTLNPVNPDLLARRANRIEKRLGKKDATTGDADIISRQWLPVDIDPKRPSGVSSSDQEHTAALEKAARIAAYLSELGWPCPVYADSGNGAHLLYRIDLPNDQASRDLIKQCLESLDTLFSDSGCQVDTAVYNAARIWKLYGTVARKGDNIESRPHRRAEILKVPESVELVSADNLTHLAGMFKKDAPRQTSRDRSRGTAIVLGDWFLSHGISYEQKPYADGNLFILDQCPFSSAHKDGAYAIQFSNGAIFAGCHHTTCGGGEQRWAELRERFDGTIEERLIRRRRSRAETQYAERNPEWRVEEREGIGDRERNGEGEGGGQGEEEGEKEETGTGTDAEAALNQAAYVNKSGEESKPDRTIKRTTVAKPDNIRSGGDTTGKDKRRRVAPDISLEADQILHTGDPLEYMLNTFAQEHIGDRVVAQCLVMSLASRQVINAKGLHVSITGDSGKGKSHSFDTMMQQVPSDLRLEGRMSDKALFYIKGLKPGTVIALDDVSLSDQMQEILKGVTTSFKKPFVYRTVNKDREGEVCIIPERCIWWVAKVDGTGDDQVWNRMLTCWIDDSEEQDERVLAKILEESASLPSGDSGVSRENLICQEMWRSLPPAYVVVPFAHRIQFSSSGNRRNPDMLLDLVRANALLNQHQREERMEGTTRCIIAKVEDFLRACRLYSQLNSEAGGQESKLTRNEAALLAAIRERGQGEITISEMQRAIMKSNSVIYKMLHGSISRGKSYMGLLEKCPALSVCDRTLVTDDERSGSAHRRAKAYSWDPYIYDRWVADGYCWLLTGDEDSKPGDDDGGDSYSGGDDCISQPGDMDLVPDGSEGGGSVPVTGDSEGSLPTSCANAENFGTLENSSAKSIEAGPYDDVGLTEPESADFATCGNFRETFGETNRKTVAEGLKDPLPAPISARSDLGLVLDVIPIGAINPDHFKKMKAEYGPGPCVCCGYTWVNYQERWRGDRFYSKKLICTKCYNRAKAAVHQTIRPLPGTIQRESFSPLYKDLGRCQICDGNKATWYDAGFRLAICDVCYSNMESDMVSGGYPGPRLDRRAGI
jgi:hypothetical protein